MSVFPYEKMDEPLNPTKISILKRLQKVDFRVWLFSFVVGSLAYDVTKIEYLLQFGFKVNTIHIPFYLIVNAFLLFTAISNHLIALRVVKIYSLMLLIVSSIVAIISPVWMFYEFDNGAPEHIRMALEHGERYRMEFGQSLAYCIYAELTVIMDVAYYAVQLLLAHEVIQVIKRERLEVELGVELNDIYVVQM